MDRINRITKIKKARQAEKAECFFSYPVYLVNPVYFFCEAI